MSEEYWEGKGCTCSAWNSDECGCNADWTDPEVYELRDRVAELEAKTKDLLGAARGLDTYREGSHLYNDCANFVKEFKV
jgi:hypothetical protein